MNQLNNSDKIECNLKIVLQAVFEILFLICIFLIHFTKLTKYDLSNHLKKVIQTTSSYKIFDIYIVYI